MTDYKCQNGDIIKAGGVYHGEQDRIVSVIAIKDTPRDHRFQIDNSPSPLMCTKDHLLGELPRDSDGYYIWSGGDRPVPGDWEVEIKLQDANGSFQNSANSFTWFHDKEGGNIIGFKVISTGEIDVQEVSREAGWNVGIEFQGPEYTGGSVSYYRVSVAKPTTIKEPYDAECNDIIEALGMNYAEGNAFKAIWRRCAARQGKAKAGYKDGLYDAEKVVFFGGRMVEQEALERGE
jgi:hypothetical protein